MPNTTISSADVNSDFSDIATALTNSIAADGQTAITAPLKMPSGTVGTPGITFSADQETGFYLSSTGVIGVSAGGVEVLQFSNSTGGTNVAYGDGTVIMPVGTVLPFAGTTIPTGWELCYGQALSSRTTYAALFGVIGTTYGSGDGTTTFNLPDLRGRTAFGRDNMGGSAANRITTAGSGVDGTTLGTGGGIQSQVISQSNVPSYSLSASGLTWTQGTTSSNRISANVAGPSAAIPNTGPFTTYQVAAFDFPVISIAGTIGGSISSGGSGASFPVLSPGLILNYIIFKGAA